MIKPIRTPADLSQAKTQLAYLIKANAEGEHDDEIEVLSTLVEQFEKTGVRIDAPSPIAAIKFRMEVMGLTPRQLEPFIGSRARVSEVLSGARQLSIDMIRSLHEGLGIPYESLISQRSANTKTERVSTPTIERLNSLGFEGDRKEMLGILNEFTSASSSAALHRKTRTQRAASRTDQTALTLWQAAILKRSEAGKPIKNFDISSFKADALRRLARLSTRSDGPAKAISGLVEFGITTVVLPSFPGTFLDGAVMAGRTGNPVIGLTLRHDRVDSFWFTLLHELAHIALHYDQLLERATAFVDDMEIQSDDIFEREADDLARESLIPSSFLSQVHWDEGTTHDEIIALGVRARVHVAIVAGRWQRDHQNYKKFARLVERGTIRSALSI
jgi:HTH-type transcriptional regulator / antitoxin HigA